MSYDDRRSGESPSCSLCGVDFTSARHWSDKPSESTPDICNLCAHDDEEKEQEPLMSRAKKWLRMESNSDQRLAAAQHQRGGSSWPKRVEPPSCWGCGHDYLDRWSPEDMATHPHEDDAPICPDCYEEAGIEESMDTFSQYTEAYGGREVPHPFHGGKKSASVTKSHVPLVWENMLGTVYARSPEGKVEYFDYDWDAAHKHAGVSNASDLRITRFDRNKHGSYGSTYERPRHKQLVLWGVHAPKTEGIRRLIIQQISEAQKEKKPYNPMPEGPKDVNPFEIHNYFMSMADWHEKEGRKHGQLGSFKPLFSRDRRHHDNRSNFHNQMQQAFAQKALDALNFQQQPDKPGVRESLHKMMHEMVQLSENLSERSKALSRTEAADRHPFDVTSLKTTHPKTYKHLLDRSREAAANTGEPDGEYGTLHHIKSLSPSKQRSEMEHSLVYHTATSLGPDMDYNLAKRLTSKVRKSVPNGDVLGAFEKDQLASHVEPHLGRSSDRFRRDGDKFW